MALKTASRLVSEEMPAIRFSALANDRA